MAKKIIYSQIRNQFRHDTIRNWETTNPILYEGEVGVVIGLNEIGDNLEAKTQKAKIGDGIHPWNELEWWSLIQSDGPDNDILVDQTYNPESENAQSGKAVAEAVNANLISKTISGKSVLADDVFPIEHNLIVALSSNTITDFSGITVTRFGKNILPPLEPSTKTLNGLTITINDNGSITANGTPTTTTFLDLATNFDIGTQNIQSGYPANGYAIKDCTYNGTWKKVSITFTANTEFIDKTYYPQIELGNKCTAYEPSNPQTVKANANGTVEGLTSYYPYLYLTADDAEVNIDCKYYVRTKNYIDGKIEGLNNFDITPYNLPIVRLYGDISYMTKDNAVSLKYQYEDNTVAPSINKSGVCDVKWQGSSSLNYPKKNYTIKFDNAFEVVDGWGEQKKYCLKANFIDHSQARNLISAKLWGEIVKSRPNLTDNLKNLPNYGAVDGFPCILTLNDEFLGLYTFNIPKDGWMFGMSDTTLQQAILCADKHCDSTRFLESATLTDDFDLEYVSNENNSDWVSTSLNNLINVVKDSDGTNLDTIANYLDWESAIDYFIFTVLIGGIDMMTKNYILTTFDGTKWFFSAYDMDSTYGLYFDGKSFIKPNTEATTYVFTTYHKVMNLIAKYKKDELKSRYQELRNGVLSELNVGYLFENFVAPIPKAVLDADVKKWTTIPSTEVNNVSQIQNWYRLRLIATDEWFNNIDKYIGVCQK